MIAAEIFHWWLGLLLFAGGVAAMVGLTLAYLKTVTATKYPNGKARRNRDEE